MLSPQELRKNDFSKSIRGYSAEEVDEHINYIIEKYTELYRANDDLERKLRTALAQIDAFKNDEASIRTALINAQKASSAIIDEASEKADAIIKSAENTCGQVLNDLDKRIKEKRDTLYKMQKMVELFKKTLFEEYQNHIQKIENITLDDGSDLAQWDLPDDYFVRNAKETIEKTATEDIVSSEFNINLDAAPDTVSDVPVNASENDEAESIGDDTAGRDIPDDVKETDYIPEEPESQPENIAAQNADVEIPDTDAQNDTQEDNYTYSDVSYEKSDVADPMKTPVPSDDDLDSDFEAFLSGGEDERKSEISNNDNPVDIGSDGDDDVDINNIGSDYESSSVSDDDDLIITSRSNPLSSDRGSIKDAIKALNSKLQSDDGIDEKSGNDSGEGLSDEEDEFIRLLKNVTSSAEEKRKNTRTLSKDEEFDLVYNNKRK